MDVSGFGLDWRGVFCMLDFILFGLAIVLRGFAVFAVFAVFACFWGAANGDCWLLMGEIHFHKKTQWHNKASIF